MLKRAVPKYIDLRAQKHVKFYQSSWFRGVMTKLAGALEEADGGAGIPFIRIDGSTDSRDRLLVGVL